MAEYIDIELALALCEDKRWRLHDIHDLSGWSVVTELQADIRALPAADVRENVMGEWIQHYETTSDNETLPYGWECSLCGRWEMEKQPFCNCGAVMKGGNDGDNLDS